MITIHLIDRPIHYYTLKFDIHKQKSVPSDVPAQPDEPMTREPASTGGYTEETGPHSSLLKCKVYLKVV